jgi:hypothetical protein
MHIAVRARRTLVRHPWIYWVGCCSLAIIAAWIVRDQLVAVDRARLSWGATRQVLVATVDHEQGQPLDAHTIEMPVAVIPPHAVAVDVELAGTIVRQRIGIGEVIVAADIASMDGPAALAPAGSVVVGIIDPLARNVAVGLDVAIASDGIVLANDAKVVDLADDVILVAVDERDAPMVAAAAHDGTASVMFVP